MIQAHGEGGSPWPGSSTRCSRHSTATWPTSDGDFSLGRAGRGGPPLRQRPGAVGRHVPLRAAHVRGHGGVGRSGSARRRTGLRPRVRRGLARRRQDRVLHDARGRAHGQDAGRARLRPGRRPQAQGGRRARHRHRRPAPRRPGAARRAGRRAAAARRAGRGRRRHALAAGRRPAAAASCSRSAASPPASSTCGTACAELWTGGRAASSLLVSCVARREEPCASPSGSSVLPRPRRSSSGARPSPSAASPLKPAPACRASRAAPGCRRSWGWQPSSAPASSVAAAFALGRPACRSGQPLWLIASLLGWAALATAVASHAADLFLAPIDYELGVGPGVTSAVSPSWESWFWTVAVVCAALAGGLLTRWALADRAAARLRRPAA